MHSSNIVMQDLLLDWSASWKIHSTDVIKTTCYLSSIMGMQSLACCLCLPTAPPPQSFENIIKTFFCGIWKITFLKFKKVATVSVRCMISVTFDNFLSFNLGLGNSCSQPCKFSIYRLTQHILVLWVWSLWFSPFCIIMYTVTRSMHDIATYELHSRVHGMWAGRCSCCLSMALLRFDN